jgi:hypothetical protein
MGKDKNTLEQRERFVSGLELRQKAGEEGKARTITGYAIVFNEPSAPLYEDEREVVDEVIAPGAIPKELLDQNDIIMTMFHDRQLLLARSKNGEGTLRYVVDDHGVKFEFDAPNTADGDKAVELVGLRVIDGCSFAFRTRYWDEDYVSCHSETRDGKIHTTYTVNRIKSIHDFTLTPNPAYPSTECDTRERFATLQRQQQVDEAAVRAQIAAARAAAK